MQDCDLCRRGSRPASRAARGTCPWGKSGFVLVGRRRRPFAGLRTSVRPGGSSEGVALERRLIEELETDVERDPPVELRQVPEQPVGVTVGREHPLVRPRPLDRAEGGVGQGRLEPGPRLRRDDDERHQRRGCGDPGGRDVHAWVLRRPAAPPRRAFGTSTATARPNHVMPRIASSATKRIASRTIRTRSGGAASQTSRSRSQDGDDGEHDRDRSEARPLLIHDRVPRTGGVDEEQTVVVDDVEPVRRRGRRPTLPRRGPRGGDAPASPRPREGDPQEREADIPRRYHRAVDVAHRSSSGSAIRTRRDGRRTWSAASHSVQTKSGGARHLRADLPRPQRDEQACCGDEEGRPSGGAQHAGGGDRRRVGRRSRPGQDAEARGRRHAPRRRPRAAPATAGRSSGRRRP